MITVVHCKKSQYEFYAGRKKCGMHYGNPFSSKRLPNAIYVGSVAESIQCFKEWLLGTAHQDVEPERRSWILDSMDELDGRVSCFCAPAPCHVDVYKDILDNRKNNDS